MGAAWRSRDANPPGAPDSIFAMVEDVCHYIDMFWVLLSWCMMFYGSFTVLVAYALWAFLVKFWHVAVNVAFEFGCATTYSGYYFSIFLLGLAWWFVLFLSK